MGLTMKILLVAVNAKYIHSNPAVYSLRAYADLYKDHIEIAEYTINNRTQDSLADIYEKKPTVLAFSCYIWNWSVIQELIVECKKILPDVPIWLGGPEVSFKAHEVLNQYPEVEGVMVGEGEETFLELAKFYVEGKTPLKEIAGIVHRDGFYKERELTDLNKVPFLYDSLLDFENRIIYYESSRGCPFRCSYCLSGIDKKVRLRDFEIVKKELQFFLDQKVPQVKFIDRTFNCNHNHAMNIWSYINEHDNGITNFHFEISADIINEEELALMKTMRPGLIQLEIGVQSTNPDTIKAINRTMNVERLKRIVDTINEGKNIHQHLDLIAGLPYEDYDTFGKSFNEVFAMHPEQLQLGFLKVLSGSEIYCKTKEYGINYTNKPPYEVLYSKWLPYEDVIRLKAIEEMVELYYNSNQFRATLAVLVRQFKTPFAMFEEMAKFYKEKGYFTNSPARSYRYHVLLEFCRETKESLVPLFSELLTYDMYIRENLKTRPDFATDLEEYKSNIRNFYEKEEVDKKYLSHYEGYKAKQLSKMTHLEIFHYGIVRKLVNDDKLEQLEECDLLCKEEIAVLFDYKKRNQLTQNANCIEILNFFED